MWNILTPQPEQATTRLEGLYCRRMVAVRRSFSLPAEALAPSDIRHRAPVDLDRLPERMRRWLLRASSARSVHERHIEWKHEIELIVSFHVNVFLCELCAPACRRSGLVPWQAGLRDVIVRGTDQDMRTNRWSLQHSSSPTLSMATGRRHRTTMSLTGAG